VLWGRLLVASLGLIASVWMLFLLIRDSRAVRQSGVNGEVLHVYEGLRSAARSLMLMALGGVWTAVHPSRGWDRAFITVALLGVIWMAVRMYRDRRKAELLAWQRIARRVEERAGKPGASKESET